MDGTAGPSSTAWTSTGTASANDRGFMSYLNAGANASTGRDANVPPLESARFSGGCGSHEL
jgi:hypothetical protein